MFSLRDLSPADRDLIRSWRNHPEVAKYMYTDHEISTEEHEEWFNKALKDTSSRYWIIRSDNLDVGFLSISQIDRHNSRCYWAFYADPEIRSRGTGSFAEYAVLQYVFGELGLNKLCGEVLEFNQSVLNMHKKFGFVQEGLLRKHIYKQGQWHDVVCIGMLREEWEAKRMEIEGRLKEKGILR